MNSYQEVWGCCIYVAWTASFLNEHLNSQNEIIVEDHEHNWMRVKQFHTESHRAQVPMLIFIAMNSTPSKICAVGELQSVVPGVPSQYSLINLRELDGFSRDELNPRGRLSWEQQPLCTYAVCDTPHGYRHPVSYGGWAAHRATPGTPPPPKTHLRVGDLVRILRVPDADLEQRDREIARGAEAGGHTADTIERVIAQKPIVRIWQIDEHGNPWYEVSLIAENGEHVDHFVAIYDDGTWERIEE